MITGIAFGRCPFLIVVSSNVSHWANETHPRHTAGFYYGVPWRAATRTNVFCMGDGVPRPIRHNVPNLSCRYVYKLLDTNSVGAKPDSPKSA